MWVGIPQVVRPAKNIHPNRFPWDVDIADPKRAVTSKDSDPLGY